ncbi:hypothetical protein PBY51_003028 [Eleginops maclovinus]|uniref:Uncharacterized protein n=1 Tax=Eleginops maclovinus TaxID=56733 RepID=A0AAN7XBA9_ELEMC|nr:hypothetical protein PBY51_003028 [Eleginops maclovinus]
MKLFDQKNRSQVGNRNLRVRKNWDWSCWRSWTPGNSSSICLLRSNLLQEGAMYLYWCGPLILHLPS